MQYEPAVVLGRSVVATGTGDDCTYQGAKADLTQCRIAPAAYMAAQNGDLHRQLEDG